MAEDIRRGGGSGGFGLGDTPHGSPGGGSGELVNIIEQRLDKRSFQSHNWTGSFFEYLDIVSKNPAPLRNAYQRAYDAILSYGHEKYKLFKKDCIRYHFFSDPFDQGADGIYGLD